MPAKSINIHVAKSTLSNLIRRAERGERITIARAGQPVAELGPIAKPPRAPLADSDPLLNLDKFAVDGPGGIFSNQEIDTLLYGA